MARRAGCQTGGRSKGRRLGRRQSPDAYRYCCLWGSRATCSFAGTNARPASDGTPRIHRPWVRVFWSTTAEETVCRTFHFANTEGSVPPTDHTGCVACGSPPDHEGSDALCGQATLLARTRQTDLDGWARRG